MTLVTPDVDLTDGRGRLLGDPTAQPLATVALLRTLVPQNQLQVPATRQTDWLIRHLPVADAVRPAGQTPPRVHLRLGSNRTGEAER